VSALNHSMASNGYTKVLRIAKRNATPWRAFDIAQEGA
jgi:hypothetical protein